MRHWGCELRNSSCCTGHCSLFVIGWELFECTAFMSIHMYCMRPGRVCGACRVYVIKLERL